jgi:hypothetical protein
MKIILRLFKNLDFLSISIMKKNIYPNFGNLKYMKNLCIVGLDLVICQICIFVNLIHVNLYTLI